MNTSTLNKTEKDLNKKVVKALKDTKNGLTDAELKLYNGNIRAKTIAIIGLGYVGLPLALLTQEKGYRVIGIDVDENKVSLIKNHTSPIVDKKIEEKLSKVNLSVTTNPFFINEADIVIICVPTPVDHNSKPDFEPLESSTRNIAKYLMPNTLVIVESTINPGVCESLVIPILESGSGLKAGKDFQISHCPERINPGDEKWSLETIDRVVGSLTPKGLKQSLEFYKSIIGEGKITAMASIKEAEAVKIVENSFRDINIAFVNELAMSFEILGIDIVNVIKGASTKPFSFLAHYPGCGVGGHCIPVDPYYLIEHARQNGFEHKFLVLGREINSNMPSYTVDLLTKALQSKNLPINSGKITILGASYKPNVDDIRESPSFVIFQSLIEKGYEPVIFDPYTKGEKKFSNIEEAIDGSIGVILATAHKEFCSLTPDFLESRGVRIIIDGRNCLNKKDFESSNVIYKGIGR